MNWFLGPNEARSVQVRYNGSPVACAVEEGESGEWVARLAEPVMGVAPGQSAVFYAGDGERVVGGGIVAHRIS
jgi:tRNA-specific 2-thiouridylase